MSDETLATFVQRERDRLNAEREKILNQQKELQQRLDAINKEFAAIEAYEAAKSGRTRPSRPASARGETAGRPRRGSKRAELLRVIASGNGLLRREILEKMGHRGNKAEEMSVSNVLTALKKTGHIE